MNRQYCQHCAYPLQTCVCSALQTLKLPLRIIIIQHKKESNHAKNTARLAKLVAPSIEIVKATTKNIEDCTKALSLDSTILLFPSKNSFAIESMVAHKKESDKAANRVVTLIFLDASWKQAYSIWLNNLNLQKFMQGHFDEPPVGNYRIRKAAKNNQLSTIEAIAYTLTLITNVDTSAFTEVFDKMQIHWEAYLPN